MRHVASVRNSRRLDNPVERAAAGGQRIDAACNCGIFDERWGVMWLEAGIDDEGTAAAPMFVFGEGVDAMDVGGRVCARECDPEEIAEGFGDELGVVSEDDEAEGG